MGWWVDGKRVDELMGWWVDELIGMNVDYLTRRRAGEFAPRVNMCLTCFLHIPGVEIQMFENCPGAWKVSEAPWGLLEAFPPPLVPFRIDPMESSFRGAPYTGAHISELASWADWKRNILENTIWDMLTWIYEFSPGNKTIWVVFDEEFEVSGPRT